MTVILALNRPGICNKQPRQRSPWTLPATPKNRAVKQDYCRRQLKLLSGWYIESGDTEFSDACHIWQQRINWIEQGKL